MTSCIIKTGPKRPGKIVIDKLLRMGNFVL